ncbi:MAG TPA: IclR family transcriptional regulator [Deltaproteobacteria bacterium]|nr:IclR family transcriptional regulator [Deltaproteobacteria bacterium]
MEQLGKVKKIKALERGVKIVLLLAKNGSSLSPKEISQCLSLPISTVYRYIETLKSLELLEETAKGYKLGLKVLELAESVRRNLDYVAIARPIMAELSMKTEETVVLAALQGDFAVWIDKINSQHLLRISCTPGKRQFLHAGASAKVIMAYLSESRQKEVIRRVGMPRFTDKTITDWEQLRLQLEQIRLEGIAISSGEVDPGVKAVAAPLFKENGEIWGSLSVVGPEQRLIGKQLELVIREVKNATNRLNTQIKVCGIEE